MVQKLVPVASIPVCLKKLNSKLTLECELPQLGQPARKSSHFPVQIQNGKSRFHIFQQLPYLGNSNNFIFQMPNNRKHRRLAAVMFTDIVGYTALMQSDEAAANAIRERHRAVFEKNHHQFYGEILQYFGDGTLSVFQSAVEAVECAIAIQQALQNGEAVPLRIGLHLGDIVFDGTEIYGDGVNLASRIESMGVAGGILLSGKLNDELKNHPHISTQSLGRFSLKNIERPVEVFAVANAGINVPARSEMKGKQAGPDKSVAVLPLLNMSADPDMEYLSDGMTEEIINALSTIKNLKVTSRTSSFFFKNKNIPLPQIGRELNVANILEGSIRLAGNKMRISVKLVDVAGDLPFWSQKFDRSIDDLFAVQDEISLLIADRLREHVGHLEIADQLVEPPKVSVENYQRYLKSRYHILKMSQSEIEKGMDILQNIIVEQPDFALAYIGIHLGYTLLGALGMMPAMEAFAAAHPYLEKAIELDEYLPEVQLHLSYEAFFQHWDFPKAYEHMQRSFEIRPTVDYYQTMASTLVVEGKFEAAENYIGTAIQIDPFSAINFHLKGFILYGQEKFGEAIGYFEKSLQLKPDGQLSLPEWGQSLILLGRKEEALAFYEKLPDLPGDLLKPGGLALVHAALGNFAEAKKGMATLEAALQTPQMERAINQLILCHSVLGNHEQALDLIAEGMKLKLMLIVYMPIDPMLKALRQYPRFGELFQPILGEKTVAEESRRKYKKSLLDKADLKKYKHQLEQLMAGEKPYLDPDLTLRSLADMLDLPPNYLSQLLNEGFDQNFAEYINSYRLETFQASAADPANAHLTLLGLAYESGFNSKTVFNSFFKKTKGLTPRAWVKKVAKK
jgi:adenylate cyclase